MVVQDQWFFFASWTIDAVVELSFKRAHFREIIAVLLFDIGLYFNLIFGPHSVVGLLEEPGVCEVDDLGLLG